MKILALVPLWLAVACAQTNPVRALRQPPSIAWEARPGFRDFGAIAVSGNTVVTGNITGTGGVFAFDAATGKLLWGTRGKQMRGEPAVDAQAVYVVTYLDGLHYRLSSLSLRTGKPNWSVEDEELGIHDAAPIVAAGRVYLISQNGKVRAYDSATGKQLWEHLYSPHKGHCPTALALAGGALYFGGGEVSYGGSQGRFLWALDAATGKELWRYRADPDGYNRDGECITAPAVADGTVVTISEHVLYALDARTGTLRWKQEVRREQKPQRLSPVLIAGGVIYSATPTGLGGWSLRTGVCEFDLPGSVSDGGDRYRMAAAGDVLYFMADLDAAQGPAAIRWQLYALDLKTKQILWKHRTNRPSRFASEAQWPTHWFLPVDGALYYENQSILVKLQ